MDFGCPGATPDNVPNNEFDVRSLLLRLRLPKSKLMFENTYILSVLTEKPYSKPLERNVVYIPITTSSHATLTKSK